jgi:hypothetical protein
MKRKRTSRRAKNKVQGSLEGTLIKVEPEKFAEAPQTERRATAIALRLSTLFSAELEAAIDIIARERVYRAMLAGLGRRLLMAPPPADSEQTNQL